MRWLSDLFVAVSLLGAGYEGFALTTGLTPPITTMARKLRRERSPLLLLIAVPWLGLGWHLFIQT